MYLQKVTFYNLNCHKKVHLIDLATKSFSDINLQ